jgi:hypothetical protein
MNKPLYLKKDLVIPAGTKFDTAPTQTQRAGEGHFITSLGLSKDSSGDLVYFAGAPESEERLQLQEWFGEEQPPQNGVARISREVLAEVLYEHYCHAVGGFAFNGDQLPGWKEFSSHPDKQKQANAWLATADKAIEIL